ncbi:putative bifunctional diguanylate cyclase/phosphodiesterase [Oceanospirillum sp.]|uniref:putative bifunctional diguanylate cyclase/phosphodiesterase n=1 Tax=Oceanospirillum sp. TaxID=2021254 RepID=UPI003A93485E
MALLRKNIWTLYTLLFAGSLLFLIFISYYRWLNIQDAYLTKQENLVELVSNASHSLFVNQEVILDVLGSELTKDPAFLQSVKKQPVLDQVLDLNPAIVGFGLATPDGRLTFISSNLNPSRLPNLLQQESSRDSFKLALTSDSMVLGRTYFMTALNEWVIPIRKAIRDERGYVIAVMTAGLRIKGASRFFSGAIHMDESNRVSLIRAVDRYPQYHSSEGPGMNLSYDGPIRSDLIQEAINSLLQRSGKSMDYLKDSESMGSFQINTRQWKSVGVARFDKTYQLWTVSEVKLRKLLDDFIESFLIYALLFLIGQVVIYQLFKLIAKAEDKRRQDLIHQASHDPLTQLPNRSYLLMHKDDWLAQDNPGFSVLFVDMDHFKSVNDSFGHEFGDEVLKELAQRLRETTPERTTLIRQGGDEFLVFVREHEDESLLSIARGIIASLSHPYQVEGINFTLGASIGIAKYPLHGTDLDSLLRASDIAMYEAKKHKNSVRIFADEMQSGYLQKLVVEQQLRKGLDNHELFMVYQPQVDYSGKLYGVEALARWQSEELGFVPPDQFISIAEASGLMPRLGEFVLRRSLSEIKHLQQETGLEFHLSINVSVRQFMQANFMALLLDTIDDAGLSKVFVCLEITESLFIEDLDYILPLLNQIHDIGIQISMDDFGTGYSSLSMLRALPVDELKIDKSFVDNILNDDAARKMVQNIIAIGKNYEMAVLAEGVETQEQADILSRFGCDRFQGYYYSRPLKPEDLKVFLDRYSTRLPSRPVS